MVGTVRLRPGIQHNSVQWISAGWEPERGLLVKILNDRDENLLIPLRKVREHTDVSGAYRRGGRAMELSMCSGLRPMKM